jgi:uncharacterized protein YhfF
MNARGFPHEQFGDSPEQIDRLAELIVTGIKTATCSAYSPARDKIKEGHRVVVLNSQNDPVCIVETIKVDVVPFNMISETYAYKEGEGDRSLEYWKKEHKRFFEAERTFSEDMLLLCEEIKVVHIF